MSPDIKPSKILGMVRETVRNLSFEQRTYYIGMSLLFASQMSDAATTSIALQMGMPEGNRIMSSLMDNYGIHSLYIYKLAITPSLAFLISHTARRLAGYPKPILGLRIGNTYTTLLACVTTISML